MIKRMVIMLLVVGLVLGGVFGFKVFQGMMIKKYMAGMGAPVQSVSTVKASLQDWQPQLTAVGSLRAVNGADLSSEVAGIVQSIAFESGSDVKQGAVLVQLRGDDDIAKLKSLAAVARIGQTNVERDEKELKVQAIAQATLDTDQATLASAVAQVNEQQAVIDKKTIRAPFAGHLGIRQVDLGQYLNPGTAIVTLQQLNPIFVDFNLPEQALGKIALGQKVTAAVDAMPGKAFDGTIIALNSKVDEATRNIQARASFANTDHKLLPGMYANVTIATGAPNHALTLPQTAITYNPYGDTVYIVDSSDAQKPVAKQSFVTLGETRGDQVTLLTGVKDGDEVVTSGQLKLHNGAPVTVNNEIQPSNEAQPKVEDK